MREETVAILDALFWSVRVSAGLLTGDYYRAEAWFNPHPEDGRGKDFYGVLEVVRQDGVLRLVEFDEFNSPAYYIRKYQGVSKRYSGYAFLQASRKRTEKTCAVLVNGMTHVERQMLEQNRLTGTFDLLTGASNSIRRGMLPLAEEIARQMEYGVPDRYYGLAEETEPGVTARLSIVIRAGRIARLFYDEIFADQPDAIADPELRGYYRQSKYHSLDYVSDYPCGFNALMDSLARRVLQTQDPMDIDGLLFSSGGFRQAAWGNYLRLAARLCEVMRGDKSLPAAE